MEFRRVCGQGGMVGGAGRVFWRGEWTFDFGELAKRAVQEALTESPTPAQVAEADVTLIVCVLCWNDFTFDLVPKRTDLGSAKGWRGACWRGSW